MKHAVTMPSSSGHQNMPTYAVFVRLATPPDLGVELGIGGAYDNAPSSGTRMEARDARMIAAALIAAAAEVDRASQTK